MVMYRNRVGRDANDPLCACNHLNAGLIADAEREHAARGRLERTFGKPDYPTPAELYRCAECDPAMHPPVVGHRRYIPPMESNGQYEARLMRHSLSQQLPISPAIVAAQL